MTVRLSLSKPGKLRFILLLNVFDKLRLTPGFPSGSIDINPKLNVSGVGMMKE